MKIITEMYGLDLKELIISWAKDKDLIKKNNSRKQILKLLEENGELIGAYLKNKQLEVKDAIGDLQVVKIILCAQNDIDLPKLDPEKEEKDHFTDNVLKTIIEGSKAGLIDIDYLLLRYSEELGHLSKFYLNYDMLDYNSVKISLYLLEEISRRLNLTLEECLTSAYQEIKDRKGKTINGSFVKSE